MNIEWKTPPASYAPAKQTPVAPFVEALKSNPGSWAFHGRKSTSTATYLRNRYGLEVVTRNNKNGKADIYARWKDRS